MHFQHTRGRNSLHHPEGPRSPPLSLSSLPQSMLPSGHYSVKQNKRRARSASLKASHIPLDFLQLLSPGLGSLGPPCTTQAASGGPATEVSEWLHKQVRCFFLLTSLLSGSEQNCSLVLKGICRNAENRTVTQNMGTESSALHCRVHFSHVTG